MLLPCKGIEIFDHGQDIGAVGPDQRQYRYGRSIICDLLRHEAGRMGMVSAPEDKFHGTVQIANGYVPLGKP